MKEEVKSIVKNALEKGRRMRALQKEYFKSRSQVALAESKKAEAAFDEALEDAAYALRNGAQRPKQGELGL